MTGLHEAFGAWIDAGARDTLPRDVALHASACPDCLQRVAAHDALASVDLGAASAPPLIPGRAGIRAAVWLPVARIAAGVAAVAFIGIAGYVAVGGLLGGRAAAPLADLDASPRGGVLSGAEASPEVTASAAADAPSDSASARASDAASAAPSPPMGGGPPPPVTPRPITAPPTSRATPTPGVLPTATAAPPPTPQPATPKPTATPTPIASATPAPTEPPPTESPPSETPPG